MNKRGDGLFEDHFKNNAEWALGVHNKAVTNQGLLENKLAVKDLPLDSSLKYYNLLILAEWEDR